MSKSGDKVITFNKVEFGEFSYDYRCRIVNGEYTVNHSSPDFSRETHYGFVCPNEIKRHPIIGIYQTEEDWSGSWNVLFLDCNLRVFKSCKNYFDELETIILGEHFSATPEMIKNMVHDLQEKNLSLRFKFPIIKYEDGRELDVSNYLLPPLLDSGEELIRFTRQKGQTTTYRFRIVNGECRIDDYSVYDQKMEMRQFVCPNVIEGYPVVGIYQPNEDNSYCKILFLDCNLRVFKSCKNYFDRLETIILGEHFSATPEMIKNMVHDLQEKNPSLRFKFPIIKYEDGRELDVSKYFLPPLLDYGEELICFTKQEGQTPTYRFRIVNGECRIDDCSDYDQKMKMKQFTCPNVIEGYPVVGIYQQKRYNPYCNECKILLLDCNLQIFETNKKEFNRLKTIILGEHFSATQEMINKMIFQLQENNPSLLKKFPEIRYWDGREFEIPSFLVPLPLVVAVQPKNSKRKLMYRTQDRNIKVRSAVMVEEYSTSKKSKEQDEYVEGLVCKIIKKFDGDIGELKEIRSVISYSSDIIINDITNLFDYKITRIDENTYEVSDSNKTARIKVMTVFDKYKFHYVGLLYNLKKEKDGSFKSGAISNYKFNALCEEIIEPPDKLYATFEEMQADLDRCTERDAKGWISIHMLTDSFKCIEINKLKLIKDSYHENAYFEGDPEFYLANGKIYAYYYYSE